MRVVSNEKGVGLLVEHKHFSEKEKCSKLKMIVCQLATDEHETFRSVLATTLFFTKRTMGDAPSL